MDHSVHSVHFHIFCCNNRNTDHVNLYQLSYQRHSGEYLKLKHAKGSIAKFVICDSM